MWINVWQSVDLDGGVNLPDKEGGSHVPEGAAHQAQAAGEEGHVAKVEGGLEEAVHPEITKIFFNPLASLDKIKPSYFVLKKK